MVRVLVDHDRIGIPKPVGDVGVIECADAEIEVVKPEAIPIPSLKMEDVARAEATREAAVLEGAGQVKAGIGRSGIVSDPPAIVFNVRRVGVSGRVAKVALRTLRLGALCGGSHGWRAMRRDVPAGETTSALFMTPVLFTPVGTTALLRIGGNHQDQQESY